MKYRIWTDQVGRYRLAAILLAVGLSMHAFRVDVVPYQIFGEEFLAWLFRLAGLGLLAFNIITESWKIHRTRRKVMDLVLSTDKEDA